MREWKLKQGDPLCLTLAADARLGGTDFSNDHIWELVIGTGEPPALALQTTFGLRARSFRLFPRFVEGDNACIDPAAFSRRPAVTKIFPNHASLEYSPFIGLDVKAEYWVPQSHAVAGRIQLTNTGNKPRKLQFEWVAQLNPNEGQRMGLAQMQQVTILAGNTDGLFPVVFLSGGPKPGSGVYPSLALTIELAAGGSQQLIWSQGALGDQISSFELARSLAAQRWEAENSRLEMLHSAGVEIYSGDADWDAALMLSQKQSLSLFVGPTPHLPNPSFVATRSPDQGHSLRGDGSDYNHLWNGQTALEAYYLAGQVLLASPDLATGVLRNFLAAQKEDGAIDWKPGLAGQRSQLLATPLLASLAWRIYEATEDRGFIEEAFPGLFRFVQAWFAPEYDRDQDGVPEWDHPMQSGFEDHPLYSSWHDWSQGLDISTAESPALCSMLFSECQALLRMACLLDEVESIQWLEQRANQLKEAVEASWDDELSSYMDRDRDTHLATPGELLGGGMGSGTLQFQRIFDQPVRLLIHIRPSEGTSRRPAIYVHGTGASGNHRIERLAEEQFRWMLGWGTMTGRHVYKTLEHVEIQGLKPDDQVEIYSASYRCLNLSLLLPLWAGIPDEERAQKIIESTLTDPQKFWLAYGLPNCAQESDIQRLDPCSSVNMTWNSLILEGLIRYGYRQLAAELFTRQMNAILLSLKSEAAFHRNYQGYTGQGSGERNALNGLAPVGRFLEILGVRLIAHNKVALQGNNLFPWPVTVKYRGMTILRQKEKTTVIFSDGQTVDVSDPEPRIVALEPV